MITMVCIILVIIVILLLLISTNYDNSEHYCSAIFILIVIYTILICILSYKQGQIDALSGNVKYKLIENSDETREWLPK